MVAPASSVPLVERTWVLFFPHLQCISIDRRSPRVLVLLKGYRMSQKKCTLSRPFTFHAWAMFCKKKTSVRCRWSCPITLQSLCHSSCLADNQIRWVIALSRTSADSHRWAALALTTGAQILHDWLPFWWTCALSPTAHKLKQSLKTVSTLFWHEDNDFYAVGPPKRWPPIPIVQWPLT